MSRLLRFFRHYKKETLLAPLFKLFEALMNLLVPLVVARIIDQGIAASNRLLIIRSFIFLIVLAVAGMLFAFVAQWFAAKSSVGFTTEMRQELFDHIQSLSYTELDTLGTDTLITRMTSDANQVQAGINMALRLLLRSPLIVLGSILMAFTIDAKSALIFLVATLVLFAVVFAIMLVSIPLFRKSQRALDRLLGITRENLSGVRVIRAFCKEEAEIQEFDERNAYLTRTNEFVGRLSALMNPASFLIVNISIILLIQLGAVRVNAGSMEQGQVVALYNYMAAIIIELIKFASLLVSINKSLACADRIADVFDIQSSMTYPPAIAAAAQDNSASASTDMTSGNPDASGPADRPSAVPDGSGADAVRFTDVSLTYAGSDETALEDISFSVRRGQTIGIIGSTGSGKSSLVNLIPRFYDATRGRVDVLGRDVRDYPKGDLIAKIGVVPQKALLFEGSIRDNLLWSQADATDEELWEAIAAAQATEVVKGKEGGLDALIEQGGRNLSGGQKQRLTIARALVKKPELLIMDDSASALDFATDAALRQAIRKMAGSLTIFIVSQRASSIRSADRILLLDDGRLVGSGNHEELLAKNQIYQEIYYSQFPEEKPNRPPSDETASITSTQGKEASDEDK
ncbi:ABC transporter transmembrane region [Shuttleworthella sp. MSX8B]|uniref:ABC transporter ATP-binding protein n=1 Tax=Shuttleworthella sp. MSX8B TaxID=936574 RepID=UPI00045257E2|nr:ABC transporter ATP-binding protein [Shuttleworthia sp. MSX8B]EUB12727.1 ABC transporter transmembrane region [Shuttleworthia sp. MSX8B]